VRIYVTGATGYLGRALCRRLVADGHEVRALVRAPERGAPLARLGVALCPGDVTDRVSLREGMSGADWVVHAAADLDLTGPAGRMEAVNVQGSENVASLAHKLGVPRLLSVSSVAYFGGSPDDGSPANEESPPRQPFPTRYSATKHAGERAIRAWAARGLGVVTVYPSLVYGPPGKKEGANAILRQLVLRRFPALVGADRLASWIFLDDVVDGIARAMTRAAPGAAYLLAGEALSVRELAHTVGRLAQVAPPRREVSVATARWALRLALPLYRLRGRRPPMPITQLDSLARHWNFDDARARRELDWSPRPLRDGLAATLAHLRDARPSGGAAA
jgi:nucleoside-diphosphate-sugar epimerase